MNFIKSGKRGVLLSVTVLTMMSCGIGGEGDAGVSGSDREDSYTTVNPEREIRRETVKCYGRIDVPPNHRYSVNAPLEAFVSFASKILPGTKVKKDETIAILRHPSIADWRERYQAAVQELEYLQPEYERKERLLREESVSERDFQRVRSDYFTAKAKVESLTEKLRLMGMMPDAEGKISSEIQLRSPADGYITRVSVNEGQLVPSGMEIVTMVNPEHIHLELDVFPDDAAYMKERDSLEFAISGTRDRKPGYIYLLGRETGPSGTVRVHGHPLKENDAFKIGAKITAYISIMKDSVTVLPRKAILREGNREYVMVRTGSDMRRVIVTASNTRDDRVPVYSKELKESDEVVVFEE